MLRFPGHRPRAVDNLDIVKQVHGGTIAVDSEVGEITEFVVTLPRAMFESVGSPG